MKIQRFYMVDLSNPTQNLTVEFSPCTPEASALEKYLMREMPRALINGFHKWVDAHSDENGFVSW